MLANSRATAWLALGAFVLSGQVAQALTFEAGDVNINLDSTVAIGTGIRTMGPSCNLVTRGASGPSAPQGCLAPTSALGDQGDLNYGSGDRFTSYLKGTHELLVKAPDDWTALVRGNWLKDFSATHTTGIVSATTPPQLTDGLSEEARSDLSFKARILDLWVSKGFQVGDQRARARVGDQVISWGESLFLPGGINATNALDIMRLSQPGTQLKEVYLPAPILSVASGLGHGLNVEAYYQAYWNEDYFPPTGSYWSVANGLGTGHDSYGLIEAKPSNSNQWGFALRYQPTDIKLNVGVYVINYTDKAPEFSTNVDGTGRIGWAYPEGRRLYGVSTNFTLGDWAIGSELSYRPRDAVALNSAVDGCASQNGNCWVDSAKYQWAVTGILSLTPDVGGGILRFLRADTGTLLSEAVLVRYPHLQRYYGNDPVSAGGWGWGQEYSSSATPESVGTKNSWGYNFDFSWVYDGTVIRGWQLVPEVYYFQAVSGRTPNAGGLFMQGAKSANFIISLLQNPTKWQFAVNYTMFWGGSRVFDQPYADRDFVGLTLGRNF